MSEETLRLEAEKQVNRLRGLATGEITKTWSADDYINDARKAVETALQNGEVVNDLQENIELLIPDAKKATAMQAMKYLHSCCENGCTKRKLNDALFFAEGYTREAKDVGADVADLEKEFSTLKGKVKNKLNTLP